MSRVSPLPRRASPAGAAARRVMGTVVVSGMLAATLLGIFFIPALFVLIKRLGAKKGKHAPPSAPQPPPSRRPSPPQ
jgi:hypothetical protein